MSLAQMLKIELFKIKRFDFYLFAGLYLFLIVAIPIGINAVFKQVLDGSNTLGFMHSVSIKLMLFGVIVAQAREYSNDVNRKKILNGYNRDDLFIAQLIIVGIYTLTILLLSLLAMPAIALALGGFSIYAQTPSFWILGLVLSNLSWGVFATFLINIFKRPLWAVLAFLGYVFIEFIFKILGQFQEEKHGWNLLIYFSPMELFNRLNTFENLTLGLLLTIVGYVLVFQLVSLFILKRRDF